MGCYLCVFTRAQVEEECDLDEIGLEFFKGGGVYSCSSLDDKPKGGCLFTFRGGGVLVGVVPELTSKSLINIFGRGALGLAGVGVAFQKMGLSNITPRRSNRVCPDTILSGVVSVTDQVAIHLK